VKSVSPIIIKSIKNNICVHIKEKKMEVPLFHEERCKSREREAQRKVETVYKNIYPNEMNKMERIILCAQNHGDSMLTPIKEKSVKYYTSESPNSF
jgi:hypothetical protein